MTRRSASHRDYRTQDFRDSPFAPKNNPGGLSPQRLAALPSLLILVGLYATQSPLVQTLESLAVVGVVLFSLFIVVLIGVLRWETRQSRAKVADTFAFEDTTQPAPPVHVGKVFEREVASLIAATTGKQAWVCGGSGDGSVDIEVLDANGRVVGIVQCKAFAKGKALAPAYVRELYAVKIQRRVKAAYLVTTAHFSREAQKEAERLDIRLMDGEALARLRETRGRTARPQPTPTEAHFQPHSL